jgi:carbon-monoxide dehydrogenase medium subunit
MWQAYHTVSTLQEALEYLAQYREQARVIAGGTDILLELERGQRPNVTTLIDITRVTGIDRITLENGMIRLGALVLHNHLVSSKLIRDRALPLAQAAWEVGAPQIRNRATVAGNVITASPANDTITPLRALGASVVLESVRGERIVPLSEFYTGLRRTVTQADELLSAILVPPMAHDERGIFLKLGLRRAQAISVVNIAAVLALDGHTVTRATIALGSVAPTIITIPEVEAFLIGRNLSPETVREAAHLASSIPHPIDDVRGSADYRVEMIRVLVARALRQLAANRQAVSFPDEPPMLWGTSHGIMRQSLPHAITHTAFDPIETTINGVTQSFATGQHKSLLDFLREDVRLPGTKEGCAEGECGACTVYLDGAAVMSCLVAAPRAHHAEIVTIEGLQSNHALHPVQSAFVEHAAVQCGYCTPGFLMAGAKLLEEMPNPTKIQVEQSITGNLCRCTGYYKIVDAILDAAKKSQEVVT